jgi:outer membrane protein TolC
VERALSTRPDVAAASRRVDAADALADEPLWRFVPSLALSAQYSVNNTATFGAAQNEWNASVTLRWVLLDPTRFADRAESLAEERVARLTAAAAARTARLDVRQALLSLQVAEGAVRQAQVGADVARRNAEETTVLYREGLARAIEVADANLRLFEADVAVARERYARDQAWLDLRASLGLDPLGREMTE